MRLRTLLGDHPGTAALKNGLIRSNLVELDFVPYSPTNTGFKPMVREGAFDVSEMAIVTYLMAKSFEKPMVLLPSVVVARHQYAHAVYRADLGGACTLVDRFAALVEGDNLDRGRFAGRDIDAAGELTLLIDAVCKLISTRLGRRSTRRCSSASSPHASAAAKAT